MALMFLTRNRNKRSNVNLSHVSPTTLAPGNLIPISFTRILANDSISFEPKAFVQAFPMNAPLVNGFKLCLEYFFIPDRIYNANLSLDFNDVTQDPDNVRYQYLSVSPVGSYTETLLPGKLDSLNSLMLKNIVAPGSLADYLDIPVGFGFVTGSDGESDIVRQQLQMTKVLGYIDVVYHYYANQQIDNILCASTVVNSTPTPKMPFSMPLSELRDLLLKVKTDTTGQAYQSFVMQTPETNYLGSWQWMCSRDSIFQRCMPPYYLESWLNTSGYTDAEITVDLSADGNSISMRNISTMSHVQRWRDLAMAGGGRYSDYINSEFDCSHLKHTSTPLYLGSDRHFLGSKVIYQTTGAGDSNSPLGAFAGQAAGGQQFRRRSYRFGEPGYFMVMASLVPDVIYTRGLDPFLRQLTLGDTYAPALDNIAMQPLMVEELDAYPLCTGIDVDSASQDVKFTFSDPSVRATESVGFVPAFSELMQRVSRAHGRLTTDLKYWILGRTYGQGYVSEDVEQAVSSYIQEAFQAGRISEDQARAYRAFVDNLIDNRAIDYSPYIDPSQYNDVFADQSPNAENFVVTFACNMRATRDKAKVNTTTTI